MPQNFTVKVEPSPSLLFTEMLQPSLLANLFYHSKPQAEAAVFAAVRLIYREEPAEHLA